MKKIDLGQTIQLLANVGVVAGIVFLAFEVRQNNQFLVADQATVRAEEVTKLDGLDRERQLLILAYPELRALYVKSLYSPADMSLEEIWGMQSLMSNRLGILRRSYETYREGIITHADWQRRLTPVQYYLGTSFGKAYWRSAKNDFSTIDGFVDAIDEELATSTFISDEAWLLKFQEDLAETGL
jgi:hypothetical protein